MRSQDLWFPKKVDWTEVILILTGVTVKNPNLVGQVEDIKSINIIVLIVLLLFLTSKRYVPPAVVTMFLCVLCCQSPT